MIGRSLGGVFISAVQLKILIIPQVGEVKGVEAEQRGVFYEGGPRGVEKRRFGFFHWIFLVIYS